MASIKARFKKIKEITTNKIKNIKKIMVDNKLNKSIVNLLNKNLIEKHISFKNPEKLEVLFGAVCSEVFYIDKKTLSRTELEIKEKALETAIKNIYEIKFRFSAIKRNKYNVYSSESIKKDVPVFKQNIVNALLEIWKTRKTSSQLTNMNQQIRRKENVEEIGGEYYIHTK